MIMSQMEQERKCRSLHLLPTCLHWHRFVKTYEG